MLENTPNVDFWQDMVKGLIVSRGPIEGVVTGMGQEIRAKSVVLTNGTFLNGVIHVGEKQFGGGRMGENGVDDNDAKETAFEKRRRDTLFKARIWAQKNNIVKGNENEDAFDRSILLSFENERRKQHAILLEEHKKAKQEALKSIKFVRNFKKGVVSTQHATHTTPSTRARDDAKAMGWS
jgi:tRNA uridine 5-carboxymethylaminomethyl modification enzyme